MHPLSHFASAPDGTRDARVLRDIEDQIGSKAEKLTSEAKLVFLAVLSRYLYHRSGSASSYSIGQAIADTQMEAGTRLDAEEANADTKSDTQGTIWDIILTLDGISNPNALGLLLFITQQQGQGAGTKARVTCFNCKELSLSVTAALDAFYQVVSLQELLTIALDTFGQSAEKRQQRTELLTICYLQQVKPYLEELQQELKEIRQRVPRAYGGQMMSQVAARVGQQAMTYHCKSGNAAVIDPPNNTWLISLPKDGFTMPKFRFGQRVQSQSRGICGRIIGMEFAPAGSECAYQIAFGWHYAIDLGTYRHCQEPWRQDQVWLTEADLEPI